MVSALEKTFPGLAEGDYAVTSPRAKRYNCIAWAAGESGKWWWPGPDVEDEYWPPSVARVETLDAFQAAFASLGFVACPVTEAGRGFEKIAFFANKEGEPTHAPRQLPRGRWTSKLGFLE